MAESKSSDWRELCAAAIKEQDAQKVFLLVDQIIEAVDLSLGPSPASRTRTQRSPL